MTPESQNSEPERKSVVGEQLAKHAFRQQRTSLLLANGSVSTFPWQQTFSMVTGSLHKDPCREEGGSRNWFVREFSDSSFVIRHSRSENTRGPARNGANLSHWLWAIIVNCNCIRSGNKSNHPIQNPLYLSRKHLNRENIYLFNHSLIGDYSVFYPQSPSCGGMGN
jgi:hypothetical protein